MIVGQVVDSFGAPVASAIVAIGTGPSLTRAFTTAEGRFLFTGLAQGNYSITAQKPGYVPGQFGRTRPNGPGQPLELADGARETNVRITVWRQGSIVGTLTDNGEPMVGVTLWTLMRTSVSGRSKFVDGPSTTTDDRGIFRFSGLSPGEYAVCVIGTQSTMPVSLLERFAEARAAGTTDELETQFGNETIGFWARMPEAGLRIGDAILHTVGPYSAGLVPPAPGENGELRTYRTTCHPSTPSLKQAQMITLAAGEERTDIDVQLTPLRSALIQGTVIGPDGPAANVGVRLAPDFAEDLGMELSWESALSISDPRGRFTFLGVPPGSYILRALRIPTATLASNSTLTSDRTLAANMPLTIGADGVADLTVTLSGGFRISGRVHFEGSRLKPPTGDLRNISVQAQPADGHQIGYSRVMRAVMQSDGSFTTWEIPPGPYVVRAFGPSSLAGFRFKAAMLKGRDVSLDPLDLQSDVSELRIVFTDEATEVSGTVRDESGQIDSATGVVIFPVDRAQWSSGGVSPRRLVHARPSASGRYRVQDLPAGQYFIVAVDDAGAEHWQDVRMLEAMSRVAQRLVIEDGDKKTVDLTTKVLR